MSEHALKLSSAQTAMQLSTDDFLWRPRPLKSSFQTSLSPSSEEFGPLSAVHADLVRFATLVYLVDRTVVRPRTWVRDLGLTVPVSDPNLWNGLAGAFADLLGFLSGDRWSLAFVRPGRTPTKVESPGVQSTGDVCLLSGGADSLSGAVLLSEDALPAFVSHSDTNIVASAQNRAKEALEALRGAEADYIRVRLTRKPRQLRSGDGFDAEPTSRTRSFLFVALGVAAASLRSRTLFMPENGFASLNVPLAGERRGSLSTRTTHPGFLEGLEGLLADAGLAVTITNPLGRLTKGEVFTQVKDSIGSAAASSLLSESYSCATTGAARWSGLPPSTHCGLCFGCLVRRGAFIAADLPDQTNYADQLLTGISRADYLTDNKLSVYRATRFAADRGVTEADVLALGLPESFSVDDAKDLGTRGLQELGAVAIR